MGTPKNAHRRRTAEFRHLRLAKTLTARQAACAFCKSNLTKEIPHNTAAHLAVPFPSVVSCRFFDLSPGLASPFSLKTVHRTVFRALEPSKPSKSARAPDEKFTRQLTTLIARYFPKIHLVGRRVSF